MRKIDFRYDVLRSNVKVTELVSVSAPSIASEGDAEIKTSFTGDFVVNDVIDYLKDEIQPYVIINDIEYPLGIYAPATYSIKNDGVNKTVSIEAYDRCWLLKAKRTDSLLYIASGTNYVEEITGLLTQCGIAFINAIPSDLTLPTDREDWDIGTDYLTIVNDLLDEINYSQVWFDATGTAIIEPKQQFGSTVERTYDFSNIKTLCKEYSSEIDYFDAPNVFVCVCSNPDHDVWVATSKNENPTSPLSIQRRGREIMEYEKVDNIASESALQEYADNLVFQHMLLYQNITITTELMPNLGTNEIVAIVHPEFFGMARETEWKMSLEPCGETEHTLTATSLNYVMDEETNNIIPAIADVAIVGISIVGVIN